MVVFGLGKKLVNKFENFLEMKSFHGAKVQKSLFRIQFPHFLSMWTFDGLPLLNVDNRGHLANYHLPHFVHVVIECPQRMPLALNVIQKKVLCSAEKKFCHLGQTAQ